jgi:hypothetical protein
MRVKPKIWCGNNLNVYQMLCSKTKNMVTAHINGGQGVIRIYRK